MLGIRGLKIFTDYLQKRQKVVEYDGKSSTERNMCGVTKGSILGPVLYLILISDLAINMPCTDVCYFADNTTFVNIGVNTEAVCTSPD